MSISAADVVKQLHKHEEVVTTEDKNGNTVPIKVDGKELKRSTIRSKDGPIAPPVVRTVLCGQKEPFFAVVETDNGYMAVWAGHSVLKGTLEELKTNKSELAVLNLHERTLLEYKVNA